MPVALYLLLRSEAEDLQHRSLRENAELIARYLAVEPDGRVALIFQRTWKLSSPKHMGDMPIRSLMPQARRSFLP